MILWFTSLMDVKRFGVCYQTCYFNNLFNSVLALRETASWFVFCFPRYLALDVYKDLLKLRKRWVDAKYYFLCFCLLLPLNSIIPFSCTGCRFSNIAVMGLLGKVLIVGACRGGFCEKLREASSMSDKASASQL